MKVVVDLSAFRLDKHFWFGRQAVPWLGENTGFLIWTVEQEIPKIQLQRINEVCNLPLTTRGLLLEEMYDYYVSEVYGSLSGGDEVTPPVSNAEEMWRLLDQPGVVIPSPARIAEGEGFAVTFECPWDPEHGVEVLFDKKGIPQEVDQEFDLD